MSERINLRREELEPTRMETALKSMRGLSIEPEQVNDTTIRFDFKGHTITYYPYTGWATGKTIKDGRGLQPLLKQLRA